MMASDSDESIEAGGESTKQPDVITQSQALMQRGDPAQAVHLLRQAIKTSGEDWRICEALGDALLTAGRGEEAIGPLMRAIQPGADQGAICVKIVSAFLSRGLIDPAVMWLRRAMAIDPDKHGQMPEMDASDLQAHRRQELQLVVDAWVNADPGNLARRHLALAMMGGVSPAKAEDDYVRKLFNDYAPRFNNSLSKLRYCGPQLVAEAIQACGISRRSDFDVLDVGCGTGLVGEMLKPYAATLVGVDIAENMLNQAEERGFYDELVTSEMNEFMQSRLEQFDLVTAADVLTYTGDLIPFAKAASGALRPGGWLIVICESLSDDLEGKGYSLNTSGRFAHCGEYVRKCLAEQGMTTRVADNKPMRYECSVPAPTLLIAAEKVAKG